MKIYQSVWRQQPKINGLWRNEIFEYLESLKITILQATRYAKATEKKRGLPEEGIKVAVAARLITKIEP